MRSFAGDSFALATMVGARLARPWRRAVASRAARTVDRCVALVIVVAMASHEALEIEVRREDAREKGLASVRWRARALVVSRDGVWRRRTFYPLARPIRPWKVHR
jgi:hypothetical protein